MNKTFFLVYNSYTEKFDRFNTLGAAQMAVEQSGKTGYLSPIYEVVKIHRRVATTTHEWVEE